jgi:integrase
MTMEEIQRRIIGGGLTDAEVAELRDCLYLKIDELLQHIKAQVAQPFVHPMVCFAAYAGARRSEILRAKITDVDFDARNVTIHEKKRVNGKLSTRRVPLASFLIAVFNGWLAVHPGGPYLFCQQAVVTRCKKRSLRTGCQGSSTRPTTATARAMTIKARDGVDITPLTVNEAHDHLKRVISDSKWKSM